MKNYHFDLEVRLADPMQRPIHVFFSVKPLCCQFYLHEGIPSAFYKVKSIARNLAEAVYILRFDMFPLQDDKVFTYQRNRIS